MSRMMMSGSRNLSKNCSQSGALAGGVSTVLAILRAALGNLSGGETGVMMFGFHNVIVDVNVHNVQSYQLYGKTKLTEMQKNITPEVTRTLYFDFSLFFRTFASQLNFYSQLTIKTHYGNIWTTR